MRIYFLTGKGSLCQLFSRVLFERWGLLRRKFTLLTFSSIACAVLGCAVCTAAQCPISLLSPHCQVAKCIPPDSILVSDLRGLFLELDPRDTGKVPYSRLQQALEVRLV